jgi:cell division protein FtsB
VSPGRWAILAGLLLATYFALQRGEYSILDLHKLRQAVVEESTSVVRLHQVVDSLDLFARAIERDPRMQERVARERFGMLKPGEFLYRLVPTGKEVRGKR